MWDDGVRLDRRALFGSAHLVQLFQRVSTFVLAVAKVKIGEYDAQHPYEGARAAWRQGRESAFGLEKYAPSRLSTSTTHSASPVSMRASPCGAHRGAKDT